MARWTVLFLVFALGRVLVAQEDDSPASGAAQGQMSLPSGVQQMKFDPEKAKEQFRQIQEQQEKMREQRLEELKNTHPEVYQQIHQAAERHEKMSDILAKVHQNRMTQEEAEAQLYPLMKQELRHEIDGLDERIERLEKKLAFLKEARKKPDVLIHQKIETLLGKRSPDDERD